MGHGETYRHNEEYAEFLANWDEAFYAKYADTLASGPPGSRILDVGCGVGQALRRALEKGYEAHGLEISEPSLARARLVSPHCQLYDGRHLPYPDKHFVSTGALNVLEHVEEPEAFITEIVRVTAPGGRIVLSSPNFMRFAGFRDYHRHMRGFAAKWRNAKRLWAKRRQMRERPDQVRFDRMDPVIKEPFEPDDDAIVATNALEIAFFLTRNGCTIEKVECTDRYVKPMINWVLNATPLRYGLFNAFVVARVGTA